MGKRCELRLSLALPVRVSGVDLAGRAFEQDAMTVDITPHGARLEGILHKVKQYSTVRLNYRASTARYSVRWVNVDQIGLQLLPNEKFSWGRSIPSIPGDGFPTPGGNADGPPTTLRR